MIKEKIMDDGVGKELIANRKVCWRQKFEQPTFIKRDKNREHEYL